MTDSDMKIAEQEKIIKKHQEPEFSK